MSKFKQRGWIGSAIDEAITRLIIIGVLVGAGAALDMDLDKAADSRMDRMTRPTRWPQEDE